MQFGWSGVKGGLVKLFLNLDKNTRKYKLKFGSVMSCTSFDLKLNCLQCIAKAKELTLLFQYFRNSIYEQDPLSNYNSLTSGL